MPPPPSPARLSVTVKEAAVSTVMSMPVQIAPPAPVSALLEVKETLPTPDHSTVSKSLLMAPPFSPAVLPEKEMSSAMLENARLPVVPPAWMAPPCAMAVLPAKLMAPVLVNRAPPEA